MSEFREHGYAPLEDYGVIGDGRSAALVAVDGSIDWWSGVALDAAPLFDSILDVSKGGSFRIAPTAEFTAIHAYEKGSNVLVTTLKTATGTLRITDSLNSGSAGRLPWSELARRVECVKGEVEIAVAISFSPVSYNLTLRREGVYGDGRTSVGLISNIDDAGLQMAFTLKAGERRVIALVVARDTPLTLPSPAEADARIDASDEAWRDWSSTITDGTNYHDALTRSLLALKLLLYSPSGAIAAAATMGLPERVGGSKNYDYRFAWVRDTAYTIKAMIRGGLAEEVHAALAWLIRTIDRHGLEVFYTLDGDKSDGSRELPYAGYKDTKPVIDGNDASGQLQLGLYGDVIETVHLYANKGNFLDARTRATVERLADDCVAKWHKKDAGIWELPETRHYTISKIGCWLALDRAVKLCDDGHMTSRHRDKWAAERDKIERFVERRCWDKKRNSYAWYAGSKGIDTSLMLATRFDYPHKDRLDATLARIESELKHGPHIYRYTGAEDEEGAFTACSFWLVEGYAFLGHVDKARAHMDAALGALTNGLGIASEMTDPSTGGFLGNLPQGLSHLALVHAIDAIESAVK